MAGLFGSGPQSNILNTVQGSYTAMLNAEKQKGQAAHEAMGAFGKAISPKAIGMTNFKNDFKDADWSKPETYARAGQQLMSFDPAAGLSMMDKGRSLAASMAPKAPVWEKVEVVNADGSTTISYQDMNKYKGDSFESQSDAPRVNASVTIDGKVFEGTSKNGIFTPFEQGTGAPLQTGPDTVVNIGVNETNKALAKDNVAALGELGDSAEFRKGNIATAKKFLKGFRDNSITSGVARKALSFVPMSFTEQSQLDEQLDSMSEQAARAKLKSLGEIRPTDADVKGMKESLFGIGRSEETNIVLLEQYVKELEQSEAKYQGLLNARADGKLGSFVLDTSSAIVSSAETNPTIIYNMFTGVDPLSDLYGRLYEGLTDTQKIIYSDKVKEQL